VFTPSPQHGTTSQQNTHAQSTLDTLPDKTNTSDTQQSSNSTNDQTNHTVSSPDTKTPTNSAREQPHQQNAGAATRTEHHSATQPEQTDAMQSQSKQVSENGQVTVTTTTTDQAQTDTDTETKSRLVWNNPGTDANTTEPSDTGHQAETKTKRQTGQALTRTVGENPRETTCPDCGGRVRITSEQYCVQCGLVVSDESIDPGKEWRSFTDTERGQKSRVGSPVTESIHDKGLSTKIGNDNTDAYGNTLSARTQQRFNRLRKWDKRFKVKNSDERNMQQAFGEIKRLTSEVGVPDHVEETACTVYRRAVDEDLLPGRSIEGMASASLYIALRQAEIPKTLDNLTEYCRVDETEITSAYSYISKELGIKIQPPKVFTYLESIANQLRISNVTREKAREILTVAIDNNVHSGKAPSGLACSAVYAAALITRCDKITQTQAADAGDVCELTVRNRQRELLTAYGIDHESVSPPTQTEVHSKREHSEVSQQT